MSPSASGTTSTDRALALRRSRMVDRQLRRRGIRDDRVLAAMGAVKRELFLPESLRDRAYRDGALPIAEDQTISQPWIVARMLELMGLTGPERVLEGGTGSGYAAAVLARCAEHVVSVERRPALLRSAAAALDAAGVRNVELRVGDGSAGVAGRAPFDAICVTASASGGEPPAALRRPLASGGALVCPVDRDGEEHLAVMRDGRTEKIASVRFVPLVEGGP
ncbi:MAG: protein-L-isoaspartate(D-aspartate) O-methyltransferase [Thermoleophilaceae bacterium]